MSGGLPRGACDAHCHIFGPAAVFPFAANRSYTPEDAPKEALFALHDRLGIDRSVIVQPAAHGFDARAMLDAIAARPDRYRGIALVPLDVSAIDLARLHAGGVRGVRFNFVRRLGEPPPLEAFRRIAGLIAPLGWHVVLHVMPDDLDALDPYLEDIPIPYVIDHMARIAAAQGLEQKGFRRLLELLRDSRAWVKISAADRISADGSPFRDAAPFMRALIDAAPDRTLWGTDWPHPNITGPVPDEAVLLELLHETAGPAGVQRILVDNPARLIGF